MAIRVKHGGNMGASALAAFDEGRKRSASQDARLVNSSRKVRPNAPAVMPTRNGRPVAKSASSASASVRAPFAAHDAVLAKLAGRDLQAEGREMAANMGTGPAQTVATHGGLIETENATPSGSAQPGATEQPQYSDKQRQEYNSRWEAYQNAVASGDFTRGVG